MTTDSISPSKPFTFIPGFWAVVAIGGLIGVGLTGNILTAPLYFILGCFCAGLAWAYMFIQWAEILGDSIALLRDPIPLSLDVTDHNAVHEKADTLKSGQFTVARASNLLKTWDLAGEPRQVIALAAFQSSQASKLFLIGGTFALLLLVVSVFLYANPWVTWGGLALLGLTVFTRQNLLFQVDRYLENHLLARLPTNVSGTAMTAADLADALGGSIEKAFKDHVPQPQQTAEAIKTAVEGVLTRVGDEIEKSRKALAQEQSSQAEQWTQSAKAMATNLKDIETALDKVGEKFKDGIGDTVGQLKSALDAHAEQVKNSGGDWGVQIKDILTEHVSRIETANHELADQLDKIATLEKNIENVLKIQEVVDGTLKTVSASEEFSNLVSTLREHLEASDTLLREVSKPRTIRLIETEGEIQMDEAKPEPPKMEPDKNSGDGPTVQA